MKLFQRNRTDNFVRYILSITIICYLSVFLEQSMANMAEGSCFFITKPKDFHQDFHQSVYYYPAEFHPDAVVFECTSVFVRKYHGPPGTYITYKINTNRIGAPDGLIAWRWNSSEKVWKQIGCYYYSNFSPDISPLIETYFLESSNPNIDYPNGCSDIPLAIATMNYGPPEMNCR